MTPIRVWIPGDDAVLRDGIRAFLARNLEVKVVLQAGATGSGLDESRPPVLQLSLQTVGCGEEHQGPTLTNDQSTDDLPRDGRGTRSLSLLTPRQREILRRIVLGQTTKSIARSLGISAKTVESHRSQLMKRLGIHDVAGLVRYAIRVGLATLDE
jgi:DNA-binding NarL/FixJ family response regulator